MMDAGGERWGRREEQRPSGAQLRSLHFILNGEREKGFKEQSEHRHSLGCSWPQCRGTWLKWLKEREAVRLPQGVSAAAGAATR